MQFRYHEDENILKGRLVYRPDEYSFDFEVASERELAARVGTAGRTSILVATLQIEISIETRQLLFFWGYTARRAWQDAEPPPINPVKGVVELITPMSLSRGISEQLVGLDEWVLYYSAKRGMVWISEHDGSVGQEQVEFADGCLVGITQGRIDSLILAPVLETP
jgi:hypothetical protein